MTFKGLDISPVVFYTLFLFFLDVRYSRSENFKKLVLKTIGVEN